MNHPKLPVPGPGLSYWQRTTRAFQYLNSNDKITVPTFSKYVIIGSGMCGSLAAYSLVQEGVAAEDIVILEAREAVSGASGRNAGHVRPDAFRGFTNYAAIHGSQQARKIIENEKKVLEQVERFVSTHQIDCDLDVPTTLDVNLTQEFSALQAKSYEAYRNAGGNVDHISVYDGDEAKTRSRVENAVSAYEWRAASVHPAKLAQWILSSVIEKGVRLWTHCPAMSITPSSTSRWDIRTSRGAVATQTVLHCTNAYAACLVPELESIITPNVAQAHSIVPNAVLAGSQPLTSTYSLRLSLHHYYSIIQRKGDGTVILGSSRLNPTMGQETKRAMLSSDDRGYNSERMVDACRAFSKAFQVGKLDTQSGEGLERSWTGIIASMMDAVPCIGEVPGRPGQWVCAGFNGHGMARIFTCAPGVAKLMCGSKWEDTCLPECFEYTEKRLKGAHEKAGALVSQPLTSRL